jgi:hypothetical protein
LELELKWLYNIHIEHYTRQPDGFWRFTERQRLEESVHIVSIECTLVLQDVYKKVESLIQ